MPGEPQPLVNNQKIVHDDGTPTDYFIRWAQQRQIDIGAGITAAQAQELIDTWAAQRSVTAGAGLSGGGTLNADITLTLDAGLGDLNDVDLSTPPTDGQALTWSAADNAWIPENGGGGGVDVHVPTYQNSWVEFGGGYRAADVTRSNGFVCITMVVKGGASNTTVFTLPAGWIPSGTVHGVMVGGAVIAEFDIFNDGRVQVNGTGVNSYASLNAMFRVP